VTPSGLGHPAPAQPASLRPFGKPPADLRASGPAAFSGPPPGSADWPAHIRGRRRLAVTLLVTKSSPISPLERREKSETHPPCRRRRRPGSWIDSRTCDPAPIENEMVVAHLASVGTLPCSDGQVGRRHARSFEVIRGEGGCSPATPRGLLQALAHFVKVSGGPAWLACPARSRVVRGQIGVGLHPGQRPVYNPNLAWPSPEGEPPRSLFLPDPLSFRGPFASPYLPGGAFSLLRAT